MGTKGAGVAVKGATTGAKALIGAERLAQLSANFTKVLERIRMGSVIKVGKKIEKIADDLDPPGTKRNSIGQLYDEKTGRYVKDPKTIGKSKKPAYKRNISERRKALLRDKDKLDPKAKEYIEKHNGRKVPNKKYNKDYDGDIDYEVHHNEPLYTKKTPETKKAIDDADNMTTIPKREHIDSHSWCGNTYHKYGPPQNYK